MLDARTPVNGAPQDLVIRDTIRLAVDPTDEPEACDIRVSQGVITDIGKRLDTDGAFVVDGHGTAAIPGFIDTHFHVWGTLLRGVVGDGPDHGWFATKGRFGPHIEPEDTYRGVRLGAAEALNAGITTIHDWAHNIQGQEDAAADLRAHQELGTRVHFTWGAPSAHPSLSPSEMRRILGPAAVQYDQTMDLDGIASLHTSMADNALVSVGINIRGPARSTEEVVRQEIEGARAMSVPIAMHCAGTRAEVERIRQVRFLEDWGLLGPDLLLAHGLHLADDELRVLAGYHVPVSMAPVAELRLAMGIPDVARMTTAGVDVSLSLDTTAISASADPFQAMRVALGLSNALRANPCVVTPREVLAMATLGGARALGLDDRVGSLRVGRRADIVLIDLRALNTAPSEEPYTAVVHSASPANVKTVMVDGVLRKHDGRLLGVDTMRLVQEAEDSLTAVRRRAGAHPRS